MNQIIIPQTTSLLKTLSFTFFKIKWLLFVLLFPIISHAQWSGTSPISTSSNVQIGSVAPPSGAKLTVSNGDIVLTNSNDQTWKTFKANTVTGQLSIAACTGSSDGPAFELYGRNVPVNNGDDRRGSMRLFSYGTSGEGISFWNYNPTNSWSRTMTITNDHKVHIGGGAVPTGAYADYKLAVEGTLVAKRVVVQISNWADYVFAPDYQLRPLEEVKSFIDQNGHLPDVPSACEVAEKGVELGDMNATLLRKIEELTLYILELKEENKTIQAKMASLENQ